MGLWNRVFMPHLVNCACSSRSLSVYREKIVPQAYGHVLEIGCGGGQNFSFYDNHNVTHLTALEPDPVMIKKAQRKAADLRAISIDFIETGAESLPLNTHSIDCAVITFVLCTIPDWKAAMSELKRVLKPKGKVLFSEHGLSPDAKTARWQNRLEPFWKPLAGGCHLTRNTQDMFLNSGFELKEFETSYARKAPKFSGYIAYGEAHLS